MLKLFADENFDNTVVRGLFRRSPKIDIVRVQDIGLSGKAELHAFLLILLKPVQYESFP